METSVNMDSSNQLDRRQFARQVAAVGGGFAAGMAAATAGAQSSNTPPAPKLPEDNGPGTAKKAEPDGPPVEALLLTFLVRRYPNLQFDDAALQGVFRDIRGDVARSDALSEFVLKNSDEPAFAFRAYRSADGTPVDNPV